MANARFSGIGITAISGRVGDEVFFRNQGGAVIRSYAIPVNTTSVYTDATRGNFGSLSSGWKTLSQAERDTWLIAAKLKTYHNSVSASYKLSGYGLYMKVNQNVFTAGNAPITIYPEPVELYFQDIPFYQSGPDMQFSYVAMAASWHLYAELTQPLSQGISNFKKYCRQLYSFHSSSSGLKSINFKYNHRFGILPATGERVGFRYWFFNAVTGQKSTPQYSSIIYL